MIPDFNNSSVLPPFIGEDPTVRKGVAPYSTTLVELINRFSTSKERIGILAGLLEYRELLRKLGFVDGIQWIDGSFVEDCEKLRSESPKDVDVVTFAKRPIGLEDYDSWVNFIDINKEKYFNPKYLKENFKCDAYFADLSVDEFYLISNITYWFGLFSHQRTTYLWKGLLSIPLLSDDQDAITLLSEVQKNAS